MPEVATKNAPVNTERVPVLSQTGKVGTIPANEVTDTDEVLTPEEVKQYKLQEEYGGVGGQLATAGIGFAQGLTADLAAPAAIALGGEGVRKAIQGYTEASPNTYTGFNLAGLGTSLLIPGEGEANLARAGLRGATAIPRGIAGLGGLAERAAASVVGHGAEGLAGRVAQGAIGMGARGAAENALYGIGNQLSEDSIAGHEITAERLYASGYNSALLGGGIGSVLGGGGALLRAGGEKAIGLAQKALPEGGIAGIAEERAAAAAGGTAQDWAKLAPTAEEQAFVKKETGRVMLDQGLLEPENGIPPARKEVARRAAEKLDDITDKLGEMHGELDRLTKVRPSTSKFVDTVFEDVVSPMRELPTQHAAVENVQNYLKKFADVAGERPTFEKMWELRQDLAKDVARSAGSDAPRAQAMTKVLGALDEEISTSAQQGAKDIGADFGSKYQLTQDVHESLTNVDRIMNKPLGAEMHTGGSSVGAGAVLGAIVHGGVGGALGAAGGLMMSVGKRAIQERGNQMAAHILDKVANLESVQAISGKMDRQLVTSVAKMLERKAVDFAATAVEKARSREHTEKAIAGVTSMASNPSMLADRTSRVFGSAENAPKIAAAFAVTSATAVNFLASKAPKMPESGNLLQPQFTKPKASDSALSKFSRYFDAVENPLMVLKHAAEGNLSREGIEALKAVYPNMYEQMRIEVQKQLPDLKKPLTWEQQKQLSILLDVPASATLEPKFIAAMQAVKEAPAPDAKSSDPLSNAGGRRPIKIDNDYSTESERIAAP